MKKIPLTNGGVALVDDEDYETLKKYRWNRLDLISPNSSKSYVKRTEKKKSFYMHRVIMNTPPKLYVDHIDNNGLNNQKSNLRNVTCQQNIVRARKVKPPSGFHGVSWRKDMKKWSARISVDGKYVWLGHYDKIEDAVDAYVKKSRETRGEFSPV